MTLAEVTQKHLQGPHSIQLATVRDNKPWICTLSGVFGPDNTLYWMSMRNTRHSQEIKDNEQVAIAILINQDPKQGLQMEGTAHTVTPSNMQAVDAIYSSVYGDKDRLQEAMTEDENLRTYYAFTPQKAQLFDMTLLPKNPHQILEV